MDKNKVYESFADMVKGVNISSERAKKSNHVCLALILIFCIFYQKYIEGYFFAGILVLWCIVLWFFYKDICDGYTRYYAKTPGEEELVYYLCYHSFDKKAYFQVIKKMMLGIMKRSLAFTLIPIAYLAYHNLNFVLFWIMEIIFMFFIWKKEWLRWNMEEKNNSIIIRGILDGMFLFISFVIRACVKIAILGQAMVQTMYYVNKLFAEIGMENLRNLVRGLGLSSAIVVLEVLLYVAYVYGDLKKWGRYYRSIRKKE